MGLLACKSWSDIRDYLLNDDRVILPLGATEEHGRHLGLGTDTIEAEAIARTVGEQTGVVVAPALPYGQSLSMMQFPGTLSLRPTTNIMVLEDLLRGLYRHGFRRVMVVNGHGGNTAPLHLAVQELAPELPGLRVKNFQWWTDPESYSLVIESAGPQTGSHAAAGETSFMLSVCPEAVHMERLTGRHAPIPESREIHTEHTFPKLYPDGIMGSDPSHSTRELGHALLQKSVEICIYELTHWD